MRRLRPAGAAVAAAPRQRRWQKFGFHRPDTPVAGGLPHMDSFAGTSFDIHRLRDSPDTVHGDYGLVTREGGVISPQQLDNAMQAMTHLADRNGLTDGLTIKRRDIGRPEQVSRVGLSDRLPDSLRGRYTFGASTTQHAFTVHLLQSGTVLFEVDTRFPEYPLPVHEILHTGMLQLGVLCAVCGRGLVDAMDERNWRTSQWSSAHFFSQPRGYVPRGSELLEDAKGQFRVGETAPEMQPVNFLRNRFRWRTPEDMHRRHAQDARNARKGGTGALKPSDVFDVDRATSNNRHATTPKIKRRQPLKHRQWKYDRSKLWRFQK